MTMAQRMILKIGKGKGFTLAEMLIVLMISTILLSMGGVFWRASGQRASIKGAIQGVVSVLNYARSKAVSSGNDVFVRHEDHCISVYQKEGDSGEEVKLEREFCPDKMVSMKFSPNNEIVFLPSGGVEEKANILLKNKIGHLRKISVSAFTGKMEVKSQ